MPDFTGGGIHTLPAHPPHSCGDPKIDERVRQLVAEFGCEKGCDLVEEMITTALKMGHDGIAIADLKLFSRSLKELRDAAVVFAPYVKVRKVVVFGSARIQPGEPSFAAAELFARKMREQNYMIITGGGEGIMGAAQRGAGREHGFGLNIRLPFEQRANETIEGDPKLVNFNYFFTRKLNFVKETHAVALFPGGFGTMDEGFEVLTLMQTGKARILPLVLVDHPGGDFWKTWLAFVTDHLLKLGLVSETDFALFSVTDDVDTAVAEILQFYRNFSSYRWVGKRMVIRLQRRVSGAAVARLNEEFAGLFDGEPIRQGVALSQEKNEPSIADLPRLIFTPFRREFGRFRHLINAINLAELEEPALAAK